MKLMALIALLLCWTTTQAATLPDNAPPLELASVHAVVAPLNATGQPLLFKHGDRRVPIASVTKLMTAMVVLDGGQSLNEWLTITPRQTETDKNAPSRMRIGSEATRFDLLLVMLMSSENLAAEVLAQNYPGGLPAFIKAMNHKARMLGMRETRFTDPAGLRTDNEATAADLVRMVNAAYDYELIRDLSTRTGHHVAFRKPRYTLQYGNTNALVHRGDWQVELSKTGYLSEAGRCLVMVTRIDGKPTTIVLLASLGRQTPLGDAGRIRRWLETGEQGRIAGSARDYERQRRALLANTER